MAAGDISGYHVELPPIGTDEDRSLLADQSTAYAHAAFSRMSHIAGAALPDNIEMEPITSSEEFGRIEDTYVRFVREYCASRIHRSLAAAAGTVSDTDPEMISDLGAQETGSIALRAARARWEAHEAMLENAGHPVISKPELETRPTPRPIVRFWEHSLAELGGARWEGPAQVAFVGEEAIDVTLRPQLQHEATTLLDLIMLGASRSEEENPGQNL